MQTPKNPELGYLPQLQRAFGLPYRSTSRLRWRKSMSQFPDVISDREDALVVLRRLRQAGHIAYFAGGCVRDTLLGFHPADWDVATDAPPARVRELFSNTQAVGAAFGVILVRQGRSIIEVATFRADLAYTDGRRP